MAVTRLFTPRPYDSFDPGISGVAPILATGTDVDNTKLTAVQAAASAAGLGTLPTSAGGSAPSPTSAVLRFRGPWQANTAYQYGDVVQIVDGSGNVLAYSANLNFTSGSTFNVTNWTELTYPGGSAASGLPSTFASFTAPTTLSSGQWAEFDCTSGPITQPLPSNPAAGATITVQKIDASANTLTVTPAGGGTIVGDPTATTSTQWGGFIYEHRGSNVWRVVPLLSTGPAGPTGASATVNVGTTTTGASGSSAAVTNSGSSTAAVLNFTVPKGDKGDTGATGAPGNATMIGFTYYNPATYASINTTSSTMVAASATNLKVTFTAPSSGNVLFRMSARAWAASGTPSIYWGLIDNNGGAVVAECIVGNDIATIRRSATLYVTGLTSGQSYTYNWGYHTTSAIQHWIDFGGAIGSSPAGPAVMEAWQVN